MVDKENAVGGQTAEAFGGVTMPHVVILRQIKFIDVYGPKILESLSFDN